jgi:hypothetical protein
VLVLSRSRMLEPVLFLKVKHCHHLFHSSCLVPMLLASLLWPWTTLLKSPSDVTRVDIGPIGKICMTLSYASGPVPTALFMSFRHRHEVYTVCVFWLRVMMDDVPFLFE